MSDNTNRLRDLLREMSDMVETSSRSNIFNINFYDNSNFYNITPNNRFINRQESESGNIENTREINNNVSFNNNTTENESTNLNNTTNTLSSDTTTDTPIERSNITRVTTQVIPIRTNLVNGDNSNISNQISEVIQNNLESILNENFTNILPSLTTLSLNENFDIENNSEKSLSVSLLNEKTTLFIIDDNQVGIGKCHICNETYKQGSICRKNKLCGHYFHQECIDIWYSEKNMCPECNQIIE